MGGLFAKSKPAGAAQPAARTTAQLSVKDKAILDLKVARDRLDKARRKHEMEKDVYVQKARELLKANKKDQAKLALRLKKMRDTQLEKISGQLFNLEQMVNDVEWAGHQREIVEGMKAGNQALKELQLDVEEVEMVMEETQEALDRQREIDEVVSGVLNPEDETEVLAELDAIEREEAAQLEAQLPQAPKEPVRPSEVEVGVGADSAATAEAAGAAADPEQQQAVLA